MAPNTQRTLFDPQDPVQDSAAEPSPATDVRPVPGTVTYIVDAFALLFQIFHAMPEMTSPQGQSVGCVFGLFRDLLFLIEEKKPDYLLVAFDLPGPTFRHELFDGYKADRGEMPAELVEQLPAVHHLLATLRIPELAHPGYEADDVIATVARRVEQTGGECVIVSQDKDCRQLLSDRVKIYSLRKNEFFDRETLLKEWGIRPDQVVDFQALVGDPVDNVPGIPLVGPKIAGELLQRFGSLDRIYQQIDQISSGKRKQNLIEHRAIALRSRTLVSLAVDLPLEVDWSAARPGQFSSAEVAELCREYGFRSLGKKFGALPTASQDDPATVLNDERVFQEWWQRNHDLDTIALHVVGSDPRPRWGTLLGCAFATGIDRAVFVPADVLSANIDWAPPGSGRSFRQFLRDANVKKHGHDLKWIKLLWKSIDVELQGGHLDTMVAAYLLDAGSRNYSLAEVSRRYLQLELPTPPTTNKLTSSISLMEPSTIVGIANSSCAAASATWQLAGQLLEELQRQQLDRVYFELEVPLLSILVEMERTGIRVDVARLEQLSQQFRSITDTLEKEIIDLAGTSFNMNAPKQLAQILFERLSLPVIKKTKTGPSTDAEVLEQLSVLHPLPALIIRYRQYSKLQSTYVDALPKMVHPQTGRIHTTFHQVVAATGRLSSSEPNLQNIPIRTDDGNEIRSAFVPGWPDWKFVSADYSQIELRVLAHYSQDASLCQAFQHDEDVHTRVASEVFQVPMDEVTSAMRRTAKAVNFGVIYGQSAFGLSKALSIEQEQALQFIEAYFQRYASLIDFMDRLLEDCRRDGFVRTIHGRRRTISGVRDADGRDWRQRNLPERTAINTVIQGSAADIMKMAMIGVSRRLRQENYSANLLLQIHDELLLEVSDRELFLVGDHVRAEMESAADLEVPLKVDVKVGLDWAHCEPMP